MPRRGVDIQRHALPVADLRHDQHLPVSLSLVHRVDDAGQPPCAQGAITVVLLEQDAAGFPVIDDEQEHVAVLVGLEHRRGIGRTIPEQHVLEVRDRDVITRVVDDRATPQVLSADDVVHVALARVARACGGIVHREQDDPLIVKAVALQEVVYGERVGLVPVVLHPALAATMTAHESRFVPGT